MSMSNPSEFHEKLFWLSVNYRHPLIMKCADKYKVREYVLEKGCGDILNELYGVYSDVQQIDNLNFTPPLSKFVVKSNKGSGDNLFILDNSFDIESLKKIFRKWNDNIYGISTAEYQYFKIPFRLICEKYLLENPDDELIEYQFFCFSGKPVSILVRNDLETAGKRPFAQSYSLKWEREFLRKNEEQYTVVLDKPFNFDKMVSYATRLCADFPHVRVDFYEVGKKLYFGELTFSTHGNIFENYKDSTLENWNRLFKLPPKYTKNDKY